MVTIIKPIDQKYIKSSLLLLDDEINFINGLGVATTSILPGSGEKLTEKPAIGIINEKYEEINLEGDDGLRFRPTTLSISRYGEKDFITKSKSSLSEEEILHKHFRIENGKVICINNDIGEYKETNTKGILITQIGVFRKLYNIFTGKETHQYFNISETDQKGIFEVYDIVCATTKTNVDYDTLHFFIDSEGKIITKVISKRLGELDLNNENYDSKVKEIKTEMQKNIEDYEEKIAFFREKTSKDSNINKQRENKFTTKKYFNDDLEKLEKIKKITLSSEFHYFINIINNTNLTDFDGLNVTNIVEENGKETIIGLKNQYNSLYLLSINQEDKFFHMYSNDQNIYFSFKFKANSSEIKCNLVFEYYKDIISISATKKTNKEQHHQYDIKYYQGIANMIKNKSKELSEFHPSLIYKLSDDEGIPITFTNVLEIAKEMKNKIKKESDLDKKTIIKK